MECFFYYDMNWRDPWCGVFWLAVIYGLVWVIIYLIDRKTIRKEGKLGIEARELLPYVIIGLAVFLMSNLGYSSLKTPFTATFYPEIFNVRTIIDLGGVAVLYAYHIQRMDLRMRYELDRMENILHNQYIQYQQSQETMDIINYKYHDLKHHIIALRAAENSEKRNDYLDKMEEELQNYEAQNKTGNQVLDTLLTSKNLYCMKNHISMTSVVDGTLFDFMDTMDICSIFGNALDNAIECEQKIAEEEKRLIHVSAFSQKSLLIIRSENYYEEEVEFDRNLPVTTKREKQFQGYGVKSLQYTVHKYGGEVDISASDNWFSLNILIPL